MNRTFYIKSTFSHLSYSQYVYYWIILQLHDSHLLLDSSIYNYMTHILHQIVPISFSQLCHILGTDLVSFLCGFFYCTVQTKRRITKGEVAYSVISGAKTPSKSLMFRACALSESVPPFKTPFYDLKGVAQFTEGLQSIAHQSSVCLTASNA